jgi:hypothetical protein
MASELWRALTPTKSYPSSVALNQRRSPVTLSKSPAKGRLSVKNSLQNAKILKM